MTRDLLDYMAPPMAPMPPGMTSTPGATPAPLPILTPRPIAQAEGKSTPARKLYDVIEGDGNARRIVVTTKREIWALDELAQAAAMGCTPIDNPAPRWSAYVFKLKRNHGLAIETITEPHGGNFKGHHARYVLRSTVRAVESEGA